MSGLVLKGLSKSFDGKPVLNEIELELSPGELLVLLGPSGCGKSTILRIIAGLEEADHGEVYIDNRRVDHLRPRERNVALVFQNYSLYPHMSIWKNLAFPLRVAGISRAEIGARVTRIAEMLGLEERLKDRPGQLSGGQRQRVALGRAIIREPSIFLLDEPLSNLDAELRVRMRQEIVRIQRQVGKTMIHVTHDQAEALTMADQIGLLNHGRLEQVGTPEELYKKPASRFVATFIGHPRINLVTAGIQEGRLIPFGIEVSPAIEKVGADGLSVGVRPECVHIVPGGAFEARVESCEYMGDSYVAHLKFREETLAVSNVERALTAGDEVRFDVDFGQLLYFDTREGLNLAL